MAELKTRILVVDDDQRLRDLLVKYLSGEGYEVKAVPDARALLKHADTAMYAAKQAGKNTMSFYNAGDNSAP